MTTTTIVALFLSGTSNNNYNNCSIVPFLCCDQHSSVHSFTLQNFTKPKLAFSVYNLSKFQMQSEHQFEKYQNRIFWYQSYLRDILYTGPSQGLTLLVVSNTN